MALRIHDDFKVKSNAWMYRTENSASIELDGEGGLRMCVGPSEALYYSDAEISDGGFEGLRWRGGNAEFKVKFQFDHFGSAGFGFWNYSMVTDLSMPIWFIYLNSRGQVPPLTGILRPGWKKFLPPLDSQGTRPRHINSIYHLKALPRLVGVKVLSSRPALEGFDVASHHLYKIEWKEGLARFYVDGLEVCSVRDGFLEGKKARLDVWIDNSVFMPPQE